VVATSYKIEVTGLRQIFDALDQVDKKASDAIKKQITKAGSEVRKAAQANVSSMGKPVSGWGPWIATDRGRDLSFEPSEVIRGIKAQRSNYKKQGTARGIGWDVWNKSAAGAIFEVVGDFSRVSDPAGRHLVSAINRRYPGKKPRILLPAYYAGMPANLKDDIRDQILTEARKAGLV
jgi:hypothetical protein